MYKNPQALDKWEIKDAGWVTAVRESDGRSIRNNDNMEKSEETPHRATPMVTN